MNKAFVFSGGGAYAVPELGIVDYILEKEILKGGDIIVGTSFGAIAGAALALGMSPDKVVNMVKVFSKSVTSFFQPLSLMWSIFQMPYSWGLTSLINVLGPFFGHTPFPDNLTVCSTDLNAFQPQLFASYFAKANNFSLCESVAASASIPGIFQPVKLKSHVYVDGGIVENVPTAVVDTTKYEIISIGGVPVSKNQKYLIGINDAQGYLSALMEGAIFRLNQEFSQDKKIQGISFSSSAKNILDFSNYNSEIQKGYAAAKNFFEKGENKI